MQAKKIDEQELVKICMAELCLREGFANPGKMVQRDFQYVSEIIESKTDVLISLSTIRRLLNGQFARLPQINTLNAIAITAGYQNWHSFELNKTRGNGAILQNNDHDVKANANTIRSIKILKNKFLVLSIVLVLVVIGSLGVLSLIRAGKYKWINADKAQFSAIKVTGNDLPNTVIFKYNVDAVIADSFFIQQSWDKNRRVKIDKNNHTLTDIYYEPGYHIAKLMANDQIIKTMDVSIPTDRWVFYAKEKTPGSQPKYVLSTNGFKDGSMQLTLNDILKSKIDIQKENIYLQVYFPSMIKHSSDNFVLKFKIRVHELNNESCPYFMGEVFCQRYFLYFKSTLKGCTSELNTQFGENYLSGKSNDFSALGTDVKHWNNVELTVKRKKVSVKINNNEVFSTHYQKTCGMITGLGFISNGLCEVDFVDLKTLDEKSIYRNDFD